LPRWRHARPTRRSSDLTGKWLGQWIVSRPVLKGRPYLMIATFFAAMWLPLNLSMAGMILIWDVFAYLNDVLGYEKKSKWLQFLRSEEHTSELQSRFDLV